MITNLDRALALSPLVKQFAKFCITDLGVKRPLFPLVVMLVWKSVVMLVVVVSTWEEIHNTNHNRPLCCLLPNLKKKNVSYTSLLR